MQAFWSFLITSVRAIMAGLVYYAGREQGKRVQKIEQNEAVHENLEKASDAINRARSDDDIADELRKKYKFDK